MWVTTLSLTIRVHLHSKCLAVVASEICEIPRNSLKIRTYSSSRSSKVIDLDVNRKRICNFQLLTNSNLERISYRFRNINAFSSKTAGFPCHLCLTRSSENSLEFVDETYPTKTRGMGLSCGEIS